MLPGGGLVEWICIGVGMFWLQIVENQLFCFDLVILDSFDVEVEKF